MLKYWTTRYLLTLFIGLLVIGIISTLWLRHNVTEKRLEMMKILAEEIADRVVDTEGNLRISPFLPRVIDRRDRFMEFIGNPQFFIIDSDKKIIYSAPSHVHLTLLESVIDSLKDEKDVNKLTFDDGNKLYLVKQKFDYSKDSTGWVILLHPEEEIARSTEEIQMLSTMLLSLALLGWVVVYLLTKKMSNPIREVADAAKQIVEGNYDIKSGKNIKEKVMYELVHSFKEMADRLKQLEMMRTELLAGVTHELKTPVTSISALIQAVHDDVVSVEEAKDFLKISLKETGRLQTMVEDLLDFNSFAVGAITVHKEKQNINQLIQEIVDQWLLVQENAVEVHVKLPDAWIYTVTDASRIQQIMINLLNNAKQVIDEQGKINVTLYEEEGSIRVDVKDNGTGIPEEEQDLIFERFFRGKGKMHKVRGLGLGLTFSKMIAKALDGDLVLQESSEKGSTFTLILPH